MQVPFDFDSYIQTLMYFHYIERPRLIASVSKPIKIVLFFVAIFRLKQKKSAQKQNKGLINFVSKAIQKSESLIRDLKI